MKIKSITLILLIFILGFLSSNMYSYFQSSESPFSLFSNELYSPLDRIQEQDIHIFQDHIVIEIENASWAAFADTNSMDPVLDKGANSIKLTPETPEDLNIGDIISYETNLGVIVHRIIEINYDSNGWYAIAKGDNNRAADKEKVRFNQINGVLVGVLY